VQFELLKRDLLGGVALDRSAACVRRDTGDARPWLRWLARLLAAREARALRALQDVEGVPTLLSWDGTLLTRAWLDGSAMQIARPRSPDYFRAARRLLARVHRAGVAHNDTAKEPNWLVRPDGMPALVDFQLAGVFPRRGRFFRLLARGDFPFLDQTSHFLLLGLVLFIATALLSGFFRIAVIRPGVRRRVWPGAMLTIGASGGASLGFAYYASHLARFALFYGTLSAVAITLGWLWLMCLTMLLGAELNLQLEDLDAQPPPSVTPTHTPQPAGSSDAA